MLLLGQAFLGNKAVKDGSTIYNRQVIEAI